MNKIYLNIQKYIKINFHNKIYKKIRIGIYVYSLKNGGMERQMASLLNHLDTVGLFKLFLFTSKKKEKNEYKIPKKTKRITIKKKLKKNNNLVKIITFNKIDIFIYNFCWNFYEMNLLNNQKNFKVIFYNHESIFLWIYKKTHTLLKRYELFKKSKYIISLIPFENDYLFKKWGINSILMNNFIQYEYNLIVPSNLSSKTILMIGRAKDKLKRLELGIKAMKYIIKEIPECEMKIISDLNGIKHLKNLIKFLKLEKSVKFVGYTSTPEIYFKNSSLHIFPSISESFGLVLAETKIYGIPNILVGLDYISLAKGGTIIIYKEDEKLIAKEAIKILKNEKLRKKLGKEARESMKKFNNKNLLKRWIKVLLSIFNGYKFFQKLKLKDKKISKLNALNILKNQFKIIKKKK